MSARAATRRRFLEASTAALAVSWMDPGRALSASRRDEHHCMTIPIIDTHKHLLDHDRFHMVWAKPGEPMGRNFSQADYNDAVQGLGFAKTVYMEVDVAESEHLKEAENVAGICESGKTMMAAAVVGGRPGSDDFESYVAKIKKFKSIKGVRQVLHGESTPEGYCLGESFINGIRLLGKEGLRFDLCMRAGELLDACKLIDHCPETKFILDHCGNPNVQSKDSSDWKKAIERLAERDRLVCKVSGLVESAKKGAWSAEDLAPFVNHVLDAFGPDRVLFAANWPVCTITAPLAQWVKALQDIVAERPTSLKAKLFHSNAERIYGLPALQTTSSSGER